MSSTVKLSEGCLEAIISGAEYERPILQVLGSRKISGPEGVTKYRLLVSDGKFMNSYAMLASQLNEEYNAGNLVDFTVIQVDRYISSIIKAEKGDKRVFIILELTVLHHGSKIGHKIGNPILCNSENTSSNSKPEGMGMMSSGSSSSSTKPTSGNSNPYREMSTNSSSSSTALSSLNKMNVISNNTSSFSQLANTSFTHPISSLSPYQNKWVIKARVTAKSAIRHWSNAKGEGKLFSMDLMDESGEIRATAFRDACDKFYELIEIGKVYFISKCQLKSANKQFSAINNDYEMTFTNETVVEPCTDDGAGIPEIQYNFVPISEIANMEPRLVVDVIGVCKEYGELSVFTGKANNREFKKRELTMVDMSNASITLTLWGDEAVNFEGHVQPIVLVKGARITEFGGGKSISIGAGSTLKVNPDIPEGHKLRGWFDNGGGENISNAISSRANIGGAIATDWLTFYEARLKNLGNGDKPDYFQTKALIHIIKHANAVYKACPQPDCNKKVIEDGMGSYRCEKCQRSDVTFKWRLLANMNIGDWTSNRWVTCFNEIAENVIGKTADEIGPILEIDTGKGGEIFSDACFKPYIFKIRTKVEMFGDVPRNRLTVIAANPINHKEYNRHLIKNIQHLTGIGKVNY